MNDPVFNLVYEKLHFHLVNLKISPSMNVAHRSETQK